MEETGSAKGFEGLFNYIECLLLKGSSAVRLADIIESSSYYANYSEVTYYLNMRLKSYFFLKFYYDYFTALAIKALPGN